MKFQPSKATKSRNQSNKDSKSVIKFVCDICKTPFQTKSGIYKHRKAKHNLNSTKQKLKQLEIEYSQDDLEESSSQIILPAVQNYQKQETLEQYLECFQSILGQPNHKEHYQMKDVIDPIFKGVERLQFPVKQVNFLFNQIVDWLLNKVSLKGLQQLCIYLIAWHRTLTYLEPPSDLKQGQIKIQSPNNPGVEELTKNSSHFSQHQMDYWIDSLLQVLNILYSDEFAEFAPYYLNKLKQPLVVFKQNWAGINLCRLSKLMSKWFCFKGYTSNEIKYNRD